MLFKVAPPVRPSVLNRFYSKSILAPTLRFASTAAAVKGISFHNSTINLNVAEAEARAVAFLAFSVENDISEEDELF